jgi:hypothetical protein
MGLKQLISFTSDTGMLLSPNPLYSTSTNPQIVGLETILRLLQALSQITAALTIASEDVQTWLLLRAQFALGPSEILFLTMFPLLPISFRSYPLPFPISQR